MTPRSHDVVPDRDERWHIEITRTTDYGVYALEVSRGLLVYQYRGRSRKRLQRKGERIARRLNRGLDWSQAGDETR